MLTLIRKGFRVAVCEQMENPAEAKKRGSKSVVKRDVVRLVTPGTLTEDSLLEARRHNFLAAYAVVRDAGRAGLGRYLDRRVSCDALPRRALGPELARLAPREVMVADGAEADWAGIVSDSGAALTPWVLRHLTAPSGKSGCVALYKVGSLDAFGSFGRAELRAMSAVAEYLDITQKGNLPLLRPPVQEGQSRRCRSMRRRADPGTDPRDAGGRQGSLLHCIDRTVTAGGARLLERRLSSPSCDVGVIAARLDAVAFLAGTGTVDRRSPRYICAACLIWTARCRGWRWIVAGRAIWRPSATRLGRRLCWHERLPDDLPPLWPTAAQDLTGHEELLDLLDEALVAEPPLLARDGGFIAPGYDAELDEARKLRDEGRA